MDSLRCTTPCWHRMSDDHGRKNDSIERDPPAYGIHNEEGRTMETLITHGAGMDVHQNEIVVCVITGPEGGEPQYETRSFPTMTQDLYDLLRWLESKEVTHIAMESTGIYWK